MVAGCFVASSPDSLRSNVALEFLNAQQIFVSDFVNPEIVV